MSEDVTKTAKLVNFEPLIEDGKQKSWEGKFGKFYEFRLKFDNGDSGIASSKTEEGKAYVTGEEYNYKLSIDKKGYPKITGLKKINDKPSTPGGGHPYYDDPTVQEKITRAWAYNLSAKHLGMLPEEEQNTDGRRGLLTMFVEYVNNGNPDTKQMLTRRQAMEAEIETMYFAAYGTTSWDKLKENAYKGANWIDGTSVKKENEPPY